MNLNLKVTTTQVFKTSVTVNKNIPIQDYVHLDDQTQPTFEMTPGFKLFTVIIDTISLQYFWSDQRGKAFVFYSLAKIH